MEKRADRRAEWKWGLLSCRHGGSWSVFTPWSASKGYYPLSPLRAIIHAAFETALIAYLKMKKLKHKTNLQPSCSPNVSSCHFGCEQTSDFLETEQNKKKSKA